MTACVNCTRTLQPAWKYCIFCGTRTGVAATAPRSRPLPKRTPVPGYASVTTSQIPIVPAAAPAPLSAAPSDEPVSSLWPENMGERPSLRSAIAATDVPAPTPPVQDGPAPDGEDEPAVEAVAEDVVETDAPIDDEPIDDEPIDDEPIDDEPDAGKVLSIADLAELHEPDSDAKPEGDAEPDSDLEPQPETRRSRTRRKGRRSTTSTGTLLEEAPAEPDTDEADAVDEIDSDPAADELDDEVEPRRKVNTLAILALLIGILACPLAALFGHLALGQLKVSDERGVIPAWIAVVLGYLWLGFWIVFGISYFATNG